MKHTRYDGSSKPFTSALPNSIPIAGSSLTNSYCTISQKRSAFLRKREAVAALLSIAG